VKALTLIFPVLLATLVLGACDDRSGDRPLTYEPGVYKGPKEAALGEATMADLRDRARRQAGAFDSVGGGAGVGSAPSATSDVRPPKRSLGEVDREALRDRMRGQGN
jgi:hypothetical protein